MIEDHLAKERESAIGEGERGETCEGKDQMSMGEGVETSPQKLFAF